MALTFGVFDHMDRSGLPLHEFYEQRLKLIEAYDRAGFYIYHVAEHHATPLGMASSPGIFLSAVAQRTSRLRFGPMVYALPLYHPLRLIEEVCMLDQMSGGRLEFGVGKGISPIETSFYGVDPKDSDAMFGEALEVLLCGLRGGTLDFDGAFYRFSHVPLELAPVQKPHPPLWYGVVAPDSAERAARRGLNVVTNTRTATVRAVADRYWSACDTKAAATLKFGMNRFIVVADTDDAALAIARRAYRRWHASFLHLWNLRGMEPIGVNYPPEFDGQAGDGRAIAGSPRTVLETLREQVEIPGVNYIGCRFAFGDLTLVESLRSLTLFAEEVMPRLQAEALAG